MIKIIDDENDLDRKMLLKTLSGKKLLAYYKAYGLNYDFCRFYKLEYAKPITIKDNCWLASNVVVCGGVTIGEGCVIGAGSVVTRDIPPYSLAAGNPCRVIRKITEKDHMPDGIEKN